MTKIVIMEVNGDEQALDCIEDKLEGFLFSIGVGVEFT